MIAIVMGVTGSGKTTVANALVALTGWHFAEGDDFHSEANKKKMHAGIPLNDEDREPWLESLHQVLLGWHQKGESGVMTCSALKQSYRDTLSAGLPQGSYHFVLLEAPVAVLEEHLANRKGHYMNPGLLQSQLDTLEEPKDAIRVNATHTPEELAREILSRIEAAKH
ncbi:gluconokinase [Paracidobacterium acidisoli]|uniref:Gluconokinase n=1 Tax=Paracidobacterium acidisoli TaxID=2303751 RepID=A0A372IU88_9BACT|nr:gluconokinase [Paracidobacterium acidisoli]MBT9329926.1 gluconokinase [Paracidobacterium acidisoli]